jgi:hypothetical protein
MDWWTLDPNLSKLARRAPEKALDAPARAPDLARRVEELEAVVAKLGQPVAG